METWGRYIIAAAFGLQGFALMAAALSLPAAVRKPVGESFGHSWVLARFGPEIEGVVGTILWGLAGLGFIVAGVGLALGGSWWTLGAWLGAPLTIIAVAAWFGSEPPGAYLGGVLAALTLGALIFNVG